MWLKKQKKNGNQAKISRFLINVNVLGSTGPIKFFVNEKEIVANVIDTALKIYAREDRLPLLGSFDVNDFLLYCAIPDYNALSTSDNIGCCGERTFALCRKRPLEPISEGRTMERRTMKMTKASAISCKKWFRKSISFKF